MSVLKATNYQVSDRCKFVTVRTNSVRKIVLIKIAKVLTNKRLSSRSHKENFPRKITLRSFGAL